MEETAEQKNNRPWLYKKGQSGNPSGRPKGSKSMKTWVKERLERMTDEEREEFMDGLSKDIIWKMAEGNPETKTDITTAGKPIIQISQEILEKHNLNETNASPSDNSEGQTQI